jgi:hypothetical protein
MNCEVFAQPRSLEKTLTMTGVNRERAGSLTTKMPGGPQRRSMHKERVCSHAVEIHVFICRLPQ